MIKRQIFPELFYMRRTEKLLIKLNLISVEYELQVNNFTFSWDIYQSRSSHLFPKCLLFSIDFQYLIITIIETNWSNQNSRPSESARQGREKGKVASSSPTMRGTDEALSWKGRFLVGHSLYHAVGDDFSGHSLYLSVGDDFKELRPRAAMRQGDALTPETHGVLSRYSYFALRKDGPLCQCIWHSVQGKK